MILFWSVAERRVPRQAQELQRALLGCSVRGDKRDSKSCSAAVSPGAEARQGLCRLHTTSLWPPAPSPGVLCSCSSSFLSIQSTFVLAAAAQSWLFYQNQSWALTLSKAGKNLNTILGKFCLSFRWSIIYLDIVKLYRKGRSLLTEDLHYFTWSKYFLWTWYF